MNNKIIFASIAIIGLIAVSSLVVSLTKTVNTFGGTTADDWNVGGNLAITGTSAFTGAVTSAAITASGAVTVSGESNLDTLVQGGDVIWVYATTTLTAAQVCNSSVINIGLATDPVMTLTLPTAANLIADCIPTAGDHKVVLVRDAASSTLAATIIAGTLIDLEGDDANADIMAIGASVELELYVATSTDGVVGVLRPFTDVD